MLNNNVLNSKDLTYEPYHQSRGEGFSGQLLFASEADNPKKNYIIKSGHAHVAACEFMFYKLAVKLGLSVARVRFVNPVQSDEFEYPACAVDFIPNAVKLEYNEFIKIEDCERLSNLSYILGDRDNLDFLRAENGVIYKIDHSDCFGIEGTAETWLNPKKITIEYSFYQMAKPKPGVNVYAKEEVLQAVFDKIANFDLSDFDDDFSLINKFCGKSFETHFRYYIGELINQCRIKN